MGFWPINHYLIESLRLLAIVAALCLLAIGAQDQRPATQLPAPPPMRAIPQAERNDLADAKDPKARIRLTIELTDTHLQHAEALASQQKYDQALGELGIYLALFDDGLTFLSKMNNDSGKTRDLYKRIELALRAHGPRLIVMRRNTPLEYGVRIKEVEEFARDGRTEALNSFYGHTVVRDGRQKKPIEDSKSKDNSHKPERQP